MYVKKVNETFQTTKGSDDENFPKSYPEDFLLMLILPEFC